MKMSRDSKVFYPAHGAGWLKASKKIEFAGEVKNYYEFEFINNSLTISAPVDNIENLKIREVNKPKYIEDLLKELAKKQSVKPPTKDYNSFINLIRELDLEGIADNFIKIIQYCNYIKTQRDKDGRLIPTSIIKYIKNSVGYLVGELAVSKGTSFEDTYKRFEKITGLKDI